MSGPLIPEQEAPFVLHPILRDLAALTARGDWRVTDLPNAQRIFAVRTFLGSDHADSLTIVALTTAIAERTDADGAVLRKFEGDAGDVINTLSKLPAPGERGAPESSGAKPPDMWAP